jgi:hypothetical protein
VDVKDTRSLGVGLPTGNDGVYSLLDSWMGGDGRGSF